MPRARVGQPGLDPLPPVPWAHQIPPSAARSATVLHGVDSAPAARATLDTAASQQGLRRLQGGGLRFLDAHEIPQRDFNVVTRQFQKFLMLDKVELVFTVAALKAAADVALDRKTGARALRSIVEEALLEVMYDIPERTEIRKCIITEETIRSGRLPLLLTKTDVDKGVDETNYEEWLAERGASA